MSTRKRKADNSLLADFLALRDSSPVHVQTGPKRQRRVLLRGKPEVTPTPLRGKPEVTLTPEIALTRVPPRSKPVTPRTAADDSTIVQPPHSSTLTPAHPHTSTTAVTESTPGTEPPVGQRTLRSALKIHSLGSLRRSTRPAGRVSFGRRVSVAQYPVERRSSRWLDLEPLEDQDIMTGSDSEEVEGEEVEGEEVEGEEMEGEEVEGEGVEGEEVEGEEVGGEGVEEEVDVEGDGVESEGVGSEVIRVRTSGAAPVQFGPMSTPNVRTPNYSELRVSRKSGIAVGKGRRPKVTHSSSFTRRSAQNLPRQLVKNLFMLSSRRQVTKAGMDLVMNFSEAYLKQVSEDLAVYVGHAGRKTVEVSDVVLLLHRQRTISERENFEYLANTHLPLDYVQELLPCAVARKQVYPHSR